MQPTPIPCTQVLAEVLQQQARLDDPGAAARQEFERSAFSVMSVRSCMPHHHLHTVAPSRRQLRPMYKDATAGARPAAR